MSGGKRFGVGAVLAVAIAGAAAVGAAQSPEAAPALPQPWRAITQDRLAHPEPGDWPNYRRTFDAAAYSPLSRINKNNVNQVRSVWSYSVPDANNWAVIPIVVNGVMYIIEAGARVVALDAVTGQTIWVHERQYPDDIATSQAYNRSRGLTIGADIVYWGTPDAHLVALDARSGRVLWDAQTGDYHTGEGHNHPGLVADGKVFMGSAGGDRTFQGKFRTFDAQTGKLLWTFNTAPQPGEPGIETWPTKFPPLGAAPWATISYDPELKLVYFGTGQPGPWSSSSRGKGDALYSNSIIALDAETGKRRWHFQLLPQEDWDRDAVFESVLVDLTINGRPRKALIQTSKIGWGVVLDRETGEFLHAFKTTYETIITGWTENGRPIVDESKAPKPEDVGAGKTFQVCPDMVGARNLNAASFSARTRLYYVGINTTCQLGQSTPVQLVQGRNFAGAFGAVSLAPGYDYVGEMVAFDPVTGQRKWAYRTPDGSAVSASALSTAGGLVFGGAINQEFFALDDASGKPLWRTRLSGDVSGGAIAYEVDGRQYVAITAGGKPILTGRYAPLTNVRVPTGGGTVTVFALPDRRDLQPVARRAAPVQVSRSGVQRTAAAASPATASAPAAQAAAGRSLYTTAQATRGDGLFRMQCAQCHAVADQTGDAFRAKWANRPLGELLSLISTTMPATAPGSLSKSDYAAIVAFMLRASGYRAGETELSSDAAALANVRPGQTR